MKAAVQSLQQYLDLYQDNRETFDKTSPAVFTELRRRAASAIEEAGRRGWNDISELPQSRLSSFFEPDYGVNLARRAFDVDVAASFRCDVPHLSTLLGVVVNDVFRPTPNLIGNLPHGVMVMSLSQAAAEYPDIVSRYLGRLVPEDDAAAQLNTMMMQDGVFVYLQTGVHLEKAIQIVNIFNSTEPLFMARRILVVAGEGSAVKLLLCDHSQARDVRSMASQVIEVFVGDRAEVEIYDIEESSLQNRRRWQLFSTQGHDSRLTANTYTLCGGISRNDYRVSVNGDHAETLLGGMAICSGEQAVDTNVVLRHNATHCNSHQLFKNALFDNSRGAFGGRIIVDEKAQFTDAVQTNRNLLVSPEARMMTAPQLEIYCDEVKCGHGATVGQLDERALFYMRSRGIPEEEARMMLTQAFMVDVIDNISFDILRERLHHLVEKRLGGAEASCASCASTCHK